MAEYANIHLKLLDKSGNEVKGEALTARFKDQIELDDWKWSLGTSSDNGDPEPTKFSFKKRMCRASTRMLTAMTSGEPMTAVVEIEDFGIKGRGDKPMFELKMTLSKVVIVSYSVDLQVADKGGQIDEDWDFDYDKIQLDYRAVTHVGTMTVVYERPAGSTLKSVERDKEQILKLARSMSQGDLKVLWQELKTMAEDEKFGKTARSSDSDGDKSGKPGRLGKPIKPGATG